MIGERQECISNVYRQTRVIYKLYTDGPKERTLQ